MFNRRQALSLCASSLALATIVGCASTPSPVTITDTLGRQASTQTLAKLVNDAGLAETLSAAGPFTLFAPSDEAFKAVPAKTMAELAGNKDMLKTVLSFHVIEGRVSSAEAKQGPIKTVNGANAAIGKAGSFITVEDAVVQQADIAASNGIVHIVDRVLMPPKR